MSLIQELLTMMPKSDQKDYTQEYIDLFKIRAGVAARKGDNFVHMCQSLEESVHFIKWLTYEGFIVNYDNEDYTLSIYW